MCALATRVLAVVFVLLLVVPAPAQAVVQGEPNLTVGLSDDTVRPGETATLSVVVANDADLEQASLSNPALNERVTTARAVEVSVEDEGPIDVRTGTHLVGSIPDGGAATLPVAVSVDADARPGTYEVPVEIAYTYTSQVSELIGAAQRNTETVTRTLTVRVEAAPVFRVVETDADLRAGESGAVSVTVENVGRTAASDAQFTLQSPDPALSSGEGATRFADRWAPGERRTLEYAVGVAEDVRPAPYTLELAPTYRDGAGRVVTPATLLVGVTPVTDSRFAVVDVSSTVVAEGGGTVDVRLRNDGAEPLREATVRLATDGGLAVDGGPAGSRFVGEWAPGETRTVRYDVRAGPDSTAGTYTLSAAVSYTGTDGVGETTRTVPVGVEVAASPTVAVETVASDAVTGGSGTVALTLRNTADRTLPDATVALAAPGTGLAVDGGESGTRFVGEWAPGETRTVTYDLTAAPTTAAGIYTLSATVGYESGTTTVTGRPLQVGVPVNDPVAFGVRDLAGDLYVGERGTVRGTVTNDGERPVRNALVVLGARSPHVSFPEGAVSVGDLAPGESATFAVETDVGAGTTAGERSFSLTVEYETEEGAARTSDAVSFTRPVAPDREPLAVDPVAATFEPDSSGRLTVNVTNTGTEPREEITLRIAPNAPLSSAAPEAYVERLAPGEATQVSFELTVDQDAVPSSLAVPLNVTSELEGGTPATDTYRVPVTVAQQPSGPADLTTLVAAAGIGIAILVAGAYWWFNR
jgi:hypothetical protein